MHAKSIALTLSLVLVMGVAVPLATADHGDRTVVEDYVSAPPVVFQFAEEPLEEAPSYGGAHVAVQDGEATVSIVVEDDLDHSTLNVVAFYDENGDFMNPPGGTGFCNTIDHHPIPDGAASVRVFTGWNLWFDFWGWDHDCDAELPSASGTVTLTFGPSLAE